MVVVGGTGWSPVHVQPVENGDCVVGGGSGASHSDSAWRDMASRRCLRMRAAAARADEGKVVVLGVEEGAEPAEESEEKELEDIGK